MTTSKVVLVSGVVALAVAVAAFFGLSHAIPASAPSAGYTQSNLGEFPEGAKLGDAGVRNVAISIPAGSDQFAYHNTSGRTQYVSVPALSTTGTASTTFTVTAGTSTAATFNGFTVQSGAQSVKALLNAFIATSSVATTTNSLQGPGAQTGQGAGVIALPDGGYLNVGIYQTYATQCTGSVCETATSTNRGFNVTGFLTVYQP